MDNRIGCKGSGRGMRTSTQATVVYKIEYSQYVCVWVGGGGGG